MTDGSGTRSLAVSLDLRPAVVRRAIAWLAIVAGVMLAGTWLFSASFRRLTVPWNEAPPVMHALVHLHLGAENVIAAWFAAMLLLLVAMASATAFVVDAVTVPSRRPLHAGWLVLALAFLALSLDELGSLHERVSAITDQGGETPIGWLALMAGLASLLACMLAFGLWHVRRVRPAFLLMVAGVVCFASIPVQEAIEVNAQRAAGAGWQRPDLLLLLEEGAELAGSLCFLAAALVHASATLVARRREARLVLRLPRQRVMLVAGALVTLLGVGLVASSFAFGDVPGAQGIPANWFPATLAVVAAGLARWSGTARGRGGFGAVAVVQVVASAFVGANLQGWRFLDTAPRLVGLTLAATVALLVGIAAVGLVRSVRGGWIRAGIAAWATLLFMGMVLPRRDLAAPLVYVASALLLFVLLLSRPSVEDAGGAEGPDDRAAGHRPAAARPSGAGLT